MDNSRKAQWAVAVVLMLGYLYYQSQFTKQPTGAVTSGGMSAADEAILNAPPPVLREVFGIRDYGNVVADDVLAAGNKKGEVCRALENSDIVLRVVAQDDTKRQGDKSVLTYRHEVPGSDGVGIAMTAVFVMEFDRSVTIKGGQDLILSAYVHDVQMFGRETVMVFMTNCKIETEIK
jgi:hypothetical protein